MQQVADQGRNCSLLPREKIAVADQVDDLAQLRLRQYRSIGR